MSLPRFLDRILDAAVPALGAISRDAVSEKLDGTTVALYSPEEMSGSAVDAGFILAANLLARLYPRISLSGPDDLVRRARSEITLVNPVAEIVEEVDSVDATLAYNARADVAADVSVLASGWTVQVDADSADETPATAPAALAAAALGVGELFRVVFGDELGSRGRRSRQPGDVNLVTLGADSDDLPTHMQPPALGEFALVGTGAIGQAAALTLAISGARGTMLAVDHERIELSNLQRYVLARDSDVGTAKVDLLRTRLAKSGIDVVPIASPWNVEIADQFRPTLVALDSAADRIAVQASLPGPIYNAWTQPADIGWSRHESFGTDPCLACLYMPTGRRPNLHEQIAAAFSQHPRRVLAYLIRGLPVGLPLNGPLEQLPNLPLPEDADAWARVPILADIAEAAGVDPEQLAKWSERPIAELYQDGICGGALLDLNLGAAPAEVLVPLAHQSALAGVMLATQLIVAHTPELLPSRAASIEGRYDVLAGFPQVLSRPRARASGCLCSDSVYCDVYAKKSGIDGPLTVGGERKQGSRNERASRP